MPDEIKKESVIEKIADFDTIEILVNEKQDILFEGIIDPPYIYLHFERIINSARNFDIVKMMGHHGNRSKELLAEVIVQKDNLI